jgi:hypothetical protein
MELERGAFGPHPSLPDIGRPVFYGPSVSGSDVSSRVYSQLFGPRVPYRRPGRIKQCCPRAER